MDSTDQAIIERQIKKNLWRTFVMHHVDASTTTIITWIVCYTVVICVAMVVVGKVFFERDYNSVGLIAALAGFCTPFITATAARKGYEKGKFFEHGNGGTVPKE
jgi:hypothetical protein